MNYKKLSTIQAKIEVEQQRPDISITHTIDDHSVQAEQRLSVASSIRLTVDAIKYPRDIQRRWPTAPLWAQAHEIDSQIRVVQDIWDHTDRQHNAINARTKQGPALRTEAKRALEIMAGNELLQRIPPKSGIKKLRNQISELQNQQKQLIPQMRAQNAEHMAQQKWDAEIQRRRDAQALTSGQFWHASRAAIKSYFNPPFDKNYLADVSAQWRAALFLECESVSYKRYSGDWGHKLSGTGQGYLCGIDDNGDEWGHEVRLDLDHDEYYNQALEATVEEAMSELFDISTATLAKCTRQGDLLFSPVEIPGKIETHAQVEPWEIRESHEVFSDGLERNGQYFVSQNTIRVTHTSHPTIILPPGSYRLYELQVADAD